MVLLLRWHKFPTEISIQATHTFKIIGLGECLAFPSHFCLALSLSKQPDGMKSTGPLYLSRINHPQKRNVWLHKSPIGENSIGLKMKISEIHGRRKQKIIGVGAQ